MAKDFGDLFRRFEEQLQGSVTLTGRHMFGGVGVFSGGVMFALIRDNVVYLKSEESTARTVAGEETRQFKAPWGDAKMPYWSVPQKVLDDKLKLTEWAVNSLKLATAQKKRK